MGAGREASAERPTADLPQLRRVWSGWKGAEEDSGLVYEVGEGVAAIGRVIRMHADNATRRLRSRGAGVSTSPTVSIIRFL
jgi:hypothetical protein